MKVLLTISTFLIFAILYSQNPIISNSMTRLNKISWEQIKDRFYISEGFGFGSCYYQIDSNKIFQEVESGCGYSSFIDSGSWKIKRNKILVLKSIQKTHHFRVLNFRNYYYLVPPNESRKIIKKLNKARSVSKENDEKSSEDEVSANELIEWYLRQNYFSKEIEKIEDN